MGIRKVICNIWNNTLEFGWVRIPLDNVYNKSGLQQLESCIVAWMGNTPSFLMYIIKVVFNIWNHSLKFWWARISPWLSIYFKSFTKTGVMHKNWVCKTPPLLMGMRREFSDILSDALKFGWVRHPPFLMGIREVVCNIWNQAQELGSLRLLYC